MRRERDARELQDAFDALSGERHFIDENSLHACVQDRGILAGEDGAKRRLAVSQMMYIADCDEDGGVNLDEFIDLIRTVHEDELESSVQQLAKVYGSTRGKSAKIIALSKLDAADGREQPSSPPASPSIFRRRHGAGGSVERTMSFSSLPLSRHEHTKSIVEKSIEKWVRGHDE